MKNDIVRAGELKSRETDQHSTKRETYNSVHVGNREVKEGDCVLVRSEAPDPPFVGWVLRIFKDAACPQHEVQVAVNRLYRPSEVLDKNNLPLATDALENEV
mmetsp:Transcript_11769/g.19969  ORF Transcript_11769/g.19969 Transcript_11769/m.19969 type:complete len:102 (-) Transcript_11769:106-411(-)|eukprot:CAMPEP_0198206676 /NCGR_PEP_ID=MMETSP1445-20131203/10217_1 /TAXON_ID=36898 /ORGANISM="Pyramimonas sp., Strain CCMP2087" /LENGTH=101 /DNA_ID=CAMNT_0043879453 /DNA_START=327 /DNA_END=632 /DNA_ORIENTATION=+